MLQGSITMANVTLTFVPAGKDSEYVNYLIMDNHTGQGIGAEVPFEYFQAALTLAVMGDDKFPEETLNMLYTLAEQAMPVGYSREALAVWDAMSAEEKEKAGEPPNRSLRWIP